jgi:carbonic anhydrase
MESYARLLEDNKKWAASVAENDPDFFKKMAAGQNPEFLWIGCADSRAPADRITNTQPGSIFVHRNVANLVVHTDINMLSVLQYAVDVLKVKHVMVVGHYGCGGVQAAMGHSDLGIINKWIRGIKDVYAANRTELESITEEKPKFDRLVELNVEQQVRNLVKTSVIQKAWARGDYPHLHGWVLRLETGTIERICEIPAGDLSGIDPIYKFDI